MPRIPDSTAPTSRAKSMVAAELSQYERERKSASVHIEIRQRNIDGKKELVGTCNEYSLSNAIPVEYTDKAKFKTYISEKIYAIYEALQ